MVITFLLPVHLIVIGGLLLGMLLSVRTGKLSVPASLAGGLTGYLAFAGAGFAGLLMLAAFFILGTLATSHRKELKAKMHADGLHEQQRTAGQVFANGGVAALSGILALIDPTHASLYVVMLAASLASATADTLSSELGTVYGRHFYNVLSFKKDQRGLDGVISLEGTLLGAAGAMVIAAIYGVAYGFGKASVLIVVAGIAGNLLDSVLGASLERKGIIKNDGVNFLNTLFAALVVWVFQL